MLLFFATGVSIILIVLYRPSGELKIHFILSRVPSVSIGMYSRFFNYLPMISLRHGVVLIAYSHRFLARLDSILAHCFSNLKNVCQKCVH